MPVSIFRGNLDGRVRALFGDMFARWFRTRRTIGQLVKAPNPKLQAPEKHQAPNTKSQRCLELRCLEFLWCLDLGIWSF